MMTERMDITGMTCNGCASKVSGALKGTPGVADVKVVLAAGEATVEYDEQLTSPRQLGAAVTDAGYGVGKTVGPQPTRIRGCCCSQ